MSSYEERARKGIEATQTLPPAVVAAQEERVKSTFFAKFWRVLSRLTRDFALQILTAYYVLTDAETPLTAKAAMAFVLLYFIAPTDWMPDFLPLVGFTDDATVLSFGLTMMSPHVQDHHRARAEATLARGQGDPAQDRS